MYVVGITKETVNTLEFGGIPAKLETQFPPTGGVHFPVERSECSSV